jgi:DNA-binding response OmpR family regulator
MTEPTNPNSAVGRKGPKILVVDDDAALRQMIEDLLESEGFTVVQAASGVRLADVVREEQPDVVVLDQIMAPVYGTEALLALRSTGEQVPVMILTGMPSEDLIEAALALELGADDFLAKPSPDPC